MNVVEQLFPPSVTLCLDTVRFAVTGNVIAEEVLACAGCVMPVRLKESIRTMPRVAIIRRRVDLLFLFI